MDPLKAHPPKVFGGPNNDPHKVLSENKGKSKLDCNLLTSVSILSFSRDPVIFSEDDCCANTSEKHSIQVS